MRDEETEQPKGRTIHDILGEHFPEAGPEAYDDEEPTTSATFRPLSAASESDGQPPEPEWQHGVDQGVDTEGHHSMTVEQAQEIAERAHAGVLDRHGRPYFDHVVAVAAMVPQDEPSTVIVALLHDTVEDTDETFESLAGKGLGEPALGALRLVTRSRAQDQTYLEWIDTIASAEGEQGRIARQVKLADNRHNQSRPQNTETKKLLDDRYLPAEAILVGAIRERDELS